MRSSVVAFTLALLLAYNFLIAVWKPNAVVSYDSNLRNRMIAENYVDFPVAPAVVVGSSMTFLLSRAFMESVIEKCILAGETPRDVIGEMGVVAGGKIAFVFQDVFAGGPA